jgi:hypothetical protein
VPSLKEQKRALEKNLIRKKFDRLTQEQGHSSPEAVFAIGVELDISHRTIERLLKEPDAPPPPPRPKPAQLDLFETSKSENLLLADDSCGGRQAEPAFHRVTTTQNRLGRTGVSWPSLPEKAKLALPFPAEQSGQK